MPQPLNTRDKMDAKVPEMRSGLRPFVVKHRKEKDSNPLLPDVPSTGAHFIPETPYDTAFLSLRLMVFQVDRKSATPIAHIIFSEGGGGGETFGLIDKLCPALDVLNRVGGRAAWWDQDEKAKLEWAPHAKFRKKIDEARKIHGIRLHDAGMKDVEIWYSGREATIETFKADQTRILSTGGKVYHLWPLDQVKRTLTLSVLVKSEMLDQLYPPKRLQSGCIKINTNTPPAPAHVPRTPEYKGMMFPYLQAKGGLTDPDKPSMEKREELIDEDIAEIRDGRDRSSSVQASRDAGKRPWNIWASTLRPGMFQPSWSPNSVPFAKHADSNNDEWWLDDLPIRQDMIDEWERITRKETVGEDGQPTWERCISEKPPNESVAGVDYQLVPELSGTYGANQNPEWHGEHIRKPKAKKDMEALPEVEQKYQNQLAKSKRHEFILSMNVAQSKEEYNRYNPRYQAVVKDMMTNQIVLDQRLDKSKSRLTQLREAVGLFPVGVVKGLDELETESPESPSGSSEQTSHSSSQEQTPRQERTARPRVTFAEPDNTMQQEVQVLPSDQVATEEEPEPFPKYEDPMVENSVTEQVAEPVNRNEMVEKLKEEARTRKATGKSITDILADTGIRREQLFSLNLSHTETAVESPPPTPATPSNLLGVPGTVRDDGEVEAPVTPSDWRSRPGVVKDDGETEATLLRFNQPAIVDEDEIDTEDAT